MATSTAKQRLIDWANAQENWVRAVVTEALASGAELKAEAVDRIYAAFLIEKELASGEPVTIAPLVASSSAAAPSEALRLTKLKGVTQVNALAEQQEIAFNPRLTVLFGENAAGKTGYVRILKRLAGARAAEPVLSDFRVQPPATPRAVIDYRLGDTAKTLEWSDQAAAPPLTRMSVFDARAVSVHVDEDLAYVFTPAELALYRHVHKAIEAVRTKLDAQVAAARPKANPFVAALARDAVVYPKLEALGPTTALDELAALAATAASDRERLDTLRDQAAALRPEASRGRLQAAAADVDFFGNLVSVAISLRTFDWAAYNASLTRLRASDQAHEKAADDALAEDGIPGASLPSWRAFIAAADTYVREVGEKSYPHRGDDCLYCRQPLKAPAVAQIKRYQRLAKDSSQTELEAAQEDLDERAERVAAIPIATVLRSVARRVESLDEVPPLLTRAAALLEVAIPAQQAAADGRPVEPAQLVKLAKEIEDSATTARSAAEALITSLKKQASERQRELDEATEQVRQLENRLVLATRMKEIERFVTDAKWAAAAAAISGRISSVLRALTEQSKAANEETLNDDFERLFLAECEALRAVPVKLDFAGRKGQAARKKLLTPAHRLSELLSEGEQGVLALADFLAECELSAAPAPIVFDDPVDRLDHKRVQHVIDRLVKLSEARQVIVFTHHLGFAEGLLGRFEHDRAACSAYRIEASGGRAGIITAAPPR